jgi:predicted lipoprotein with Yx(FWY)xxD motif
MLLVLAGCSNGDDNEPTDAGTAAEDEAMETPDEEAAEDDDTMAAGTVTVGTTDLGDVLVDTEGMTLYMFDPDAQGDSTCYDDCATAWPPLLVDGDPAAGDGVDAALLGTTERTDGTVQVTYNDWPLYYWAQDAAVGDATGQAVNDVWWVLDATGEPIRD